MNLAIKKGTGLDRIVEKYMPQMLEEVRVLQHSHDCVLTEVLPLYTAFLKQWSKDKNLYPFYGAERDAKERNLPVLTPEDIDRFLITTVPFEKRRWYDWITGIFVTQLLQNSYDAGYRQFVLSLHSVSNLSYIGQHLRRNKSDLLEVTLLGGNGTHYGVNANGCTFILDSARPFSGLGAVNCTFKTRNPELAEEIVKNIDVTSRVELDNDGQIIVLYGTGTKDWDVDF